MPVDVTVTAMEQSADADFDPSNEDLEGRPVWVYRFTVSSATAFDGTVDPWEILNGMWTADGGADSVLLVNPGDCVLPATYRQQSAEGCKWAAVEHGTEILGVSWVSVADDRYSGVGESVNWLLEDPVSVPEQLAEPRDRLVDRLLAGGREGTHVEEPVDQARVRRLVHLHARGGERVGVGDPLVAQRVELGGDDDRRRLALEIPVQRGRPAGRRGPGGVRVAGPRTTSAWAASRK